MHASRTSALLLALLALGATPALVSAQGGMLGRVRRAAEEVRRTKEEVKRTADELKPKPGTKSAEADKKPAAADTIATSPASAAAPQRPGEGAWANYDFVPGERPLLVTDFSGDVIGDFPRRLEASEGNFEVVEWQGARWLRANGGENRMYVPAGVTLPSRWTLEFELLAEGGECWIYPSGNREPGVARLRFGAEHSGGLVRGDGRDAGTRGDGDKRGTPFTARVMVDGRYVKAYVNEQRVVNVPNLDYTRGESLLFWCDGRESSPMYLRNIRLAAGGRKLYDAIAESGRVATQGIYFDVGSDQLRPESTPTLKEIGAMLAEHADLRLAIEGHTDNSGSAAANKLLSQKRAESVRAYLISTFGVAADRLRAEGIGQEKPAASNATPEGRQQNRRVELVRVP